VAFRATTIPGRRKKKRVGLGAFGRACKIHLAGASRTCPHEPKWKELYPLVAKPEDSDDAKQEAAAALVREGATCGKLALSPTACHGCSDNPLDKASPDQQLVSEQSSNLQMIDRLHTAARLGLLKLSDLQIDEFEMLRVYFWEVEKNLRATAPQ
jgi:hypothetical protein